jgi:hypothetical protein
VLRASHSCEGEVVGSPFLFLDDDVGPALPWWWGKCLLVALRWGSQLCRASSGRDVAKVKGSVLLPWLGVCDWLGAYPGVSLQ